MQISRHWRMNAQRYRLEGVRYNTGDVSLQSRPAVVEVKRMMVSEVREESKPAVTAQVA